MKLLWCFVVVCVWGVFNYMEEKKICSASTRCTQSMFRVADREARQRRRDVNADIEKLIKKHRRDTQGLRRRWWMCHGRMQTLTAKVKTGSCSFGVHEFFIEGVDPRTRNRVFQQKMAILRQTVKGVAPKHADPYSPR